MKKILCWFLTITLLMTMVVMPAFAETVSATDPEKLCSCGCGQTLEQIQWTPWNPEVKGNPLSGHYYLEGDYTQSKQYQVNSSVRVVIDLRGHRLTTEKSRLFLIYGYVAFVDTVGGGLLSAAATGTANGGAIMVAWDAVAMNDEMDATVELYDCTVTLEQDTNALNGGVFNISNNSTLRANNCKFFSTSALERGGVIYQTGANSVVELKNTEFYDAEAKGNAGGAIYSQGSLTLENCRISGCTAKSYGGGIYQSGNSLTIKNSVLENNGTDATANGGGNLYAASGAKVNMTGVTIRGGYSACNGGNVYLGKGSFALISCTISGGVAAAKGNNLYCTDTNAEMSLNNCTVSGDMEFAGKKLTLKNKTNIAINNTGLVLGSGTQLVNTDLTGTVYQGAGYCPHCNRQVTWTAMGAAPSGHCYLTADITRTAAYEITADTVIDLRGFDITSSDRVFTIASAGKLTVLDSVGGSQVKGSGNADGLGGVYKNAGELTICGGKHVYAKGSATVTAGGVIQNDKKLTVTGGYLDGSAFNNTASSSCVGGTVNNNTGSSLTVSGGYFKGGTAYAGGNLRVSSGTQFTITGGSFIGGTASYIAGNIQITGAKTTPSSGSIQNALIRDGVSNGTSGAGNLFIGYCAPTMTNCLVVGGSAPNAYGGNISIGTSGDPNATDLVVLSGSAPKGGNFYSASYLAGGTFTDCEVLFGSANGTKTETNSAGGNLFLNHGCFTMSGGRIAYGTANGYGGNIFTNAGNYADASAQDDGLWLEGGILLTGGKSGESGGNLYNQGDLVLTDCRFENGQAAIGQDLYYGKGSNGCSLTVGTAITGKLSIGVDSKLMGSSIYGGTIANTTATTLNAEMILEGQVGTPILCVNNGKLCVGGISVKTANSEVWYPDGAAAVAACPENGWVKLYTDADLVLTKDCRVDLNGRTATISGDCTLYGMDSSGDDFTIGSGKAVWASAQAVHTAAVTEAVGGNYYMAVVEGAAATYHRLQMELTAATLRTESCGIYYKGTWGCDSLLAEKIASYGVAVSLQGQPTADLTDCLYSEYDGAGLRNGEVKTGVLIKHIMKDNLPSGSNQRRGEMPIYAEAYVTLTDGTVLVANQDISWSLRETMEEMDRLIVEKPLQYLRNDVWSVRDFYTAWDGKGMENWRFNKLEQPKDDGVLKIMILGSSRSVNTFQLLYEAFKDQMPDGEFVMGVMYYSGCSMTMHEKFIKGNEAVYQYYRNDNGRWVITSGMTMADGLHADNWDVILLQAGTGDTSKNMQKDTRDFLKSYVDDHLIDPYDLWWHTTWFNSTDPDLYKPPKTAADAAAVDQIKQLTDSHNAAINYVLDDPMFAGHITSGTPMMYALKVLGLQDKDLFRDHTHLSDFGCLLVAYAFYAQYTGKAVTEIHIDTIPVALRHKDYQSLGDMTVTDEMKQIIIDTVAYTLENPWSVPTGQ